MRHARLFETAGASVGPVVGSHGCVSFSFRALGFVHTAVHISPHFFSSLLHSSPPPAHEMVKCTACDAVLVNHSAQTTHVDVVCVMYLHKCRITGEPCFLVVRDPLTLKLTCWCAGGSCGKSFDRIREMRSHLKHAVGPWQPPGGHLSNFKSLIILPAER